MVDLDDNAVDTASGSMADVPKDMLAQINKLEEIFTVPKEKLKQITDRFVGELTKGLTREGGSIVSKQLRPTTAAVY